MKLVVIGDFCRKYKLYGFKYIKSRKYLLSSQSEYYNKNLFTNNYTKIK